MVSQTFDQRINTKYLMIITEDHLKKYGWTMHNGRDFGKHEMIDDEFNTKITASFIKQNYQDKVTNYFIKK